MKTERVLEWLDEIRAGMPGHQPALLKGQFDEVKQHLVALENEKRQGIMFSMNTELFNALSARFNACVFIGAATPAANQPEQVICLHRGPASHCSGLLPFGQNLIMASAANNLWVAAPEAGADDDDDDVIGESI